MSQPVSCREMQEALAGFDDWVSGVVEDARLAEHLAGCASCQALATDLRRIRDAAAALPEREPPARLWSSVAARLQNDPAWQRQSVLARFRGGAPPTTAAAPPWPRWWMAVAAGLILAIGVSVGLLVRRAPAPPRSVEVQGTPGATPASIVQNLESELAIAAQHYDNVMTGLEQLAAGGNDLDQSIVATLKANLATIDQAINESRVALAEDPESEAARTSLLDAFRRKVALMQDTLTLINDVRQGDAAGAARAMGNLNKS